MKNHLKCKFSGSRPNQKGIWSINVWKNQAGQRYYTEYSVWIELLFFEWEKLIPVLEKYFPDILDEMLNCDNQRSTSANGKVITSFRCNHTNIGRIQGQLSPRSPQPRNRDLAKHHNSFCHRTPEVSHNNHQNILRIDPYLSQSLHF